MTLKSIFFIVLLAASIVFEMTFKASGVLADPARWIIKDKDTTIILFGTIHVLPANSPWLSSLMRADLRQMDRLYLEVDPADAKPEVIVPLVQKSGLYSGESGLFDKLPQTLGRALRGAAGDLKLDVNQLNSMKPWLAATTVTAAAFRKAGYVQQNRVEAELIAQIESAGDGVVLGLDSMQDQINLYASLAFDQQVALLDQTLDQADSAREFVRNLSTLWLAGQVRAAERLITQKMEKIPGLRSHVLESRNRQWAQKIKNLMAEPGAFMIAIRIDHFSGPENILDILSAKQVVVSRLDR